MSGEVRLTKADVRLIARVGVQRALPQILGARVADALRYAADGCTNEADRQWVHSNANEYDPAARGVSA